MKHVSIDSRIVNVFWWDLSEDVRHQIVKKYHREYNDFLNGKFTGVFSEELKKLIKLDETFLNSAEFGFINIIEACIRLGADIHVSYDLALRRASEEGHLVVVKYLIEHGADVHAEDDHSLRWAANNGHLEVVKYLVDCGANIHAGNDRAMEVAVEKGHTEIAEYLKSLG